MEDFLGAKNDPASLQVWTNTIMGEPFEDRGEQPEWLLLQARAEPYDLNTVPDKVRMLTAGIDVQDDRLVMSVYGWAEKEEAWLIWHSERYGDPAQPKVWAEIDEMLRRKYKRIDTRELVIASAAVDSGGHHQQQVFRFCRDRPVCMAIRGASQSNKPVLNRPTLQDVSYTGGKFKNGVQLWLIGTDTAKSTIYARLKIADPGPGHVHFPIGLPEEYFLQLTAEKKVTKYAKGYKKFEWIKVRARNEALDCLVYAYAAAIRAGVTYRDLSGGGGAKPMVKNREKTQKRPNRW